MFGKESSTLEYTIMIANIIRMDQKASPGGH